MDFLVLHESGPVSWERFVSGEPVTRGADVIRYWERVRALGVDPRGPTSVESILPRRQLVGRRERLAQLLAVSSEVLESTASAFSDRHFVLLLADADGVVLRAFGGGQFEDVARRARLIEGASWSEGIRGTNAIGTALIEERPVVVGGFAHFERVNHELICYAIPIHDPHGEVAAALDATSFAAEPDPLVRAALVGAAHAIEVSWRHAAFAGQGLTSRAIAARLAGHEGPALLVAPGGAVVRHNERARALLPEARGARATVQRALGVRWEDLREALDGSSSRLELEPRAGLREEPLRLELEPIEDGSGLLGVVVSVAARRAARTPSDEGDDAFAELFGADASLERARTIGRRFARSSLPVLLLAETGTGKDLMARAIHRASDRSQGPFVAVNCGALSETLLESELFGYGPGAFTGARPEGREGRLGAADGGTLFLDEVGEMPASLQALLLRVLEDGSYTRVGELEARRADIRLVCATCRDLPAMVERGEFRRDLYYRIRGACVTLPPLREREDIIELARYLLARLCEQLDIAPCPTLSPGALTGLHAHDWPGNVRELKTALHHALILSDDLDTLDVAAFPEEIDTRASTEELARGRATSIEETELRALRRAHGEAGGNISEMARILGVARSTVYRMMRRHDFDASS